MGDPFKQRLPAVAGEEIAQREESVNEGVPLNPAPFLQIHRRIPFGDEDMATMESALAKSSPLDFFSSFLPSLVGSRTEMGIALAPSVALLLGFVFFVFLRRRSGCAVDEPLKPFPVKTDRDKETDEDGKKKVVVFFGTQTSTAEGFAKVTLGFGSRESL